MPRDTIFMLAPGFEDNDRREFCPECAELFGLLAYYPAIRDAVEIVHVGIDQPRMPINAILGEGNFNAPTLIIAEGTDSPDGVSFKTANGHKYMDSARAIAALWAARYGIPARRGS